MKHRPPYARSGPRLVYLPYVRPVPRPSAIGNGPEDASPMHRYSIGLHPPTGPLPRDADPKRTHARARAHRLSLPKLPAMRPHPTAVVAVMHGYRHGAGHCSNPVPAQWPARREAASPWSPEPPREATPPARWTKPGYLWTKTPSWEEQGARGLRPPCAREFRQWPKTVPWPNRTPRGCRTTAGALGNHSLCTKSQQKARHRIPKLPCLEAAPKPPPPSNPNPNPLHPSHPHDPIGKLLQASPGHQPLDDRSRIPG